MDNFTPVSALIGGALIGLAASVLLLFNGRTAGISGILGGMVSLTKGDTAWRAVFLGALVVGALLYRLVDPASAEITITGSVPMLVVGGLVVGYGTRLGSGCTSGHGVCGIAKLSGRSIVATLCFMAAAAVTVYVARHVVGG